MEKSNDKNAQAFKMEGNWSSQSKELKSKYPQLTDTDLKVETGKEDEMLDRVENRLKKNREEVISIIRKEQPGNGQSKSDQPKNDHSKMEQSREERSKKDQSENDRSKKDHSENEQSKNEQPKNEQSNKGRSKEEQSINDQPNKDRSKRD